MQCNISRNGTINLKESRKTGDTVKMKTPRLLFRIGGANCYGKIVLNGFENYERTSMTILFFVFRGVF